MKKNNIYSLLLLMAGSLLALPVTAQSGLEVSKTVKETVNGVFNGDFTLTLDAYAQGAQVTTTSEVSTPLDVVLVLDGSMNMCRHMGQGGEDDGYIEYNSSIFRDNSALMLEKFGPLQEEGKLKGYYTFRFDPFLVGDYDCPLWRRYPDKSDIREQWEVYRQGSYLAGYAGTWTATVHRIDGRIYKSKLGVLFDAMKSILDKLREDSNQHKVCVLKYGNYNGSSDNYSVLQNWTTLSSSTVVNTVVSTVKNSNFMEEKHGGYQYDDPYNARVDKGLDGALAQLQTTGDDGHRKVVLLITGTPYNYVEGNGSSNDWRNAVNKAYNVKHNGSDGTGYSVNGQKLLAKIYVANIQHSQDVSGNTKIQDDAVYSYISSNFPEAKVSGSSVTGNSQATSDCYKPVIGNTLAEVFNSYTTFFEDFMQVTEEGGAPTTLGADVVLKDVVADKFKVTSRDGIHVYKVSYGESGFASTRTDITSSVTLGLSSDNKTVTVSGFDYTSTDNWCGPRTSITINSSGSITGRSVTYKGNKLVVEIPITALNAQNGAFDTNTNASGVYKADNTKVAAFDIPKVVFNTIKIVRQNLEPGESAIYQITCKRKTGSGISESNDNRKSFRVVVTRKNMVETDPFVLVKMLPQGQYTVTEESSATGWAWATWPGTGNISKVSNTSDSEMLLSDGKTYWTVTFQGVEKASDTYIFHDEKYKRISVE